MIKLIDTFEFKNEQISFYEGDGCFTGEFFISKRSFLRALNCDNDAFRAKYIKLSDKLGLESSCGSYYSFEGLENSEPVFLLTMTDALKLSVSINPYLGMVEWLQECLVKLTLNQSLKNEGSEKQKGEKQYDNSFTDTRF